MLRMELKKRKMQRKETRQMNKIPFRFTRIIHRRCNRAQIMTFLSFLCIYSIGLFLYYPNYLGTQHTFPLHQYGECLRDLKEVLDSQNQTFFLVSGTTLGYVRNGSFISYTEDIDVGVFFDDFDFEKVYEALEQSDKFYKIKTKRKLNESMQVCGKHVNGVEADIFIYYHHVDNIYYQPTTCPKLKEAYCKWKHTINGLKTIDFNGGHYLIPSNAEEYLEEHYGEDWRTPKDFGYREALKKGYLKSMLNEE